MNIPNISKAGRCNGPLVALCTTVLHLPSFTNGIFVVCTTVNVRKRTTRIATMTALTAEKDGVSYGEHVSILNQVHFKGSFNTFAGDMAIYI